MSGRTQAARPLKPLRSLLPNDHVPAAPRPAPPVEPIPQPAPPSRDQNQNGQANKIKRTGLVKLACTNCRDRKAKCSGGRPRCARCTARNEECIYLSENPEETSGQVLKRKFGELQDSSAAHREVLQYLCKSHWEAAVQGLKDIRTYKDAVTFAKRVKRIDLMFEAALQPDIRMRYEFPLQGTMPRMLLAGRNPYIKSLVYVATMNCSTQALNTGESPSVSSTIINGYPRQYLAPYFAASLAEPLLSDLDVARWTSVSEDNRKLCKILEAYFLHDYPIYPIFHKDIFLDAVKSGNRQYCSSLLVNAVLAEACHCYSALVDRATFWDPNSLGYRFLAEARRLWEEEQFDYNLTNVQASAILNLVYNFNGMDQIGLVYLQSSVALAKGSGILDNITYQDETQRVAYQFTAWGLFRWQASQGLYFYRAPPMKAPPPFPVPDPGFSPDPEPDTNPQPVSQEKEPVWHDGEVWVQYPEAPKVATHFGELFKAYSRFREFVNEIGCATFPRCENARGRTLSRVEIQNFRSRLGYWFISLPTSLHPSQIVYPAQFKLHMEYWMVHFKLLQIEAGQRSPGALVSPEKRSQAPPADSVLEAAAHIEAVVRIYYLRHSFQAPDTLLTMFLMTIAELMIAGIKAKTGLTRSDDLTSLRATLILCLKGLHEQGRNVHVSTVLYRIYRDLTDKVGLDQLRHYVAETEEDASQPLSPQRVRSHFPVTTKKLDEDTEDRLMANLAKKYHKELSLR